MSTSTFQMECLDVGASILFSDWPLFELGVDDIRVLCFRHKGERFRNETVLATENRVYGCILVLGGITDGTKPGLV